MTVEANISGRIKAQAAIELLMSDLQDSEVQAAARALQAHAESILGKPEPPSLSCMDEAEARDFQRQPCQYSAYRGHLWKSVPRGYIETLADYGLELQRYLRSDIGVKHAE